MANELFHESVPVILHDDDLNAMYFSVENRSPYLDTDLFDWSQQIPTRHLVRNGRAKAVLRDAVRGLVPDAVIDNPRKVGFNAPLLDYLDTRSNAVRQELLSDSPIFDIVRRDADRAPARAHRAAQQPEQVPVQLRRRAHLPRGVRLVKWCRSCILPDTRPNLTLDADGICNACRNHGTKRQIDWNARAAALRDAVAQRQRQRRAATTASSRSPAARTAPGRPSSAWSWA